MIKSAFEALSRCFYFGYLVIHSHGIVLSTGFYFFVKLIFFLQVGFAYFSLYLVVCFCFFLTYVISISLGPVSRASFCFFGGILFS